MLGLPWLERIYSQPRVVKPGSLAAYFLATAIVAASTAFRMSIDHYVAGMNFVFLSFGIIAATFFCGVLPGVLACAEVILAEWYVILPPRFSFQLANRAEVYQLISFSLFAAADLLMVGLLRRSLARTISLRGFYLAAFNANPDAIIVTNRTGLIIGANERATAMFGYSYAALRRLHVDILIPDCFETISAGHPVCLIADPEDGDQDSLGRFARRAKGGSFPVEVQTGYFDADGELRFIVNVRDVTAQKAAAAALAESYRREAALEERQRGAEELRQANVKLSKIIESAPVAIWALDPENRITIWNPATEKLYGIPAVDVIGKYSLDIVVGRVPEGTLSPQRLLDLALEQEGFHDIEIRRLASGGAMREISLSAALLRDSGGDLSGILFIGNEVGQAREMARRLNEAQKAEAIAKLTGGVAHDFNNLLAVMFGNLELLNERLSSDPDSLELLRETLTASEYAANLTHRMLAFSRQLQLAPRAVEIGELVGETIDVLKRMIDRSITISANIDDKLWKARIDPGQLANALVNLAVNARDAMPNGGRLTITAENTTLDEDYCRKYEDIVPGYYIRLSVTDTGTGMAQSIVDQATEPFFTTKGVGKGSGLGLSMVFGFIKQSGGHLSIYSEENRGTTVNLYVPEFGEREPQAKSKASARDTAPNNGQVVLVVDDDASLRKLQIRAISSLGYRTLEATGGVSALALLKGDSRVDVMLTDIGMPDGMNGPELAVAARAVRPALKIIFMSGYPSREIMQRFNLGNAQYLAKPFSRPELAKALERELGTPANNHYGDMDRESAPVVMQVQ